MPNLKQLLESNHVQESEYYFEIWNWKEEDYDIYKNIGRGVITPCVDARREVLCFMYITIPNTMDKGHYLSPSAARYYIDRLKLSHIKQKNFLTDLCEKKSDVSAELVSDKAKDRVNAKLFQSTKLRAIAICNNCNAPWYIFSLNGIGSINGPSQGYLGKLQEKI